MSNRNENCKIINFDFRKTEEGHSITRDQLATMIRKVLTPAELFKLNAPKHKRGSDAEVIDFCNYQSEEKSNA